MSVWMWGGLCFCFGPHLVMLMPLMGNMSSSSDVLQFLIAFIGMWAIKLMVTYDLHESPSL